MNLREGVINIVGNIKKMAIDYKQKYQELSKEYKNLEKIHNRLIRHRRHNVRNCKYCKEWYEDIKRETKKIKDKKLRESLLETWETLWINQCPDIDIIAHTFYVNAQNETNISKHAKRNKKNVT